MLPLAELLKQRGTGPGVDFLFGAAPSPARTEVIDLMVPLLRIRDRSGRLVQLRPNAAQQLYARQRRRRNIILKARQLGMTTYIAARFFLATILRPGTVTLQVAHTLESAQQIFLIVRRFAEHLPERIGRIVLTSRENVRELAFAKQDSRYIVDTAGNRRAGRGLTIHNLHASEVAQWPGDARETMVGLLAALAPGGGVDIESTPHGTGNYFHTEWLRSKDRREFAGARFTPHFFPWWLERAYRSEAPFGTAVEPVDDHERLLVEREGLKLEQILFRRRLRATFGALAPQEYAENDAECFLASGRPVFDIAAIGRRLPQAPEPLRVGQNGAEIIWFEPVAGRSYIVGADVAEGHAEGDFSAAVVVDTVTGLQCAELCARWPIAHFAEELARLAARYNHALVAVERNNHGHAVLYALEHQLAYPRIYRHREPWAADSEKGWPMNARTKPTAIASFNAILRDAPEVIASARLLEQCRDFSYADGGEMGAAAGGHDDLVIAAAIAYTVRAHAGDPQFFSVVS